MAKDTFGRKDKKYALIKLNERQGDLEPTDVPVNFNGNAMLLKRNEFVPVPSGVIEILDNATRPVTDSPKSGKSGDVVISKRKIVAYAKRFPFQFISWLSSDEYVYLKEIAKQRSITEKEANDVVYGASEKAA
jgi:hypothetical protein